MAYKHIRYPMLVAIGQQIKRAREKRKLTPEIMAKKIRMTEARYEAIEQGANFTVIELAKISDVLGIEPKDILA